MLFANAMDEAAKNVDEDENRRRERRAALHWEYLKKTPEATPLLHAVNERSGDKNKDKFLSSSTSSTIVRQRDPSNSVSSSNSSSVFLPMGSPRSAHGDVYGDTNSKETTRGVLEYGDE